MSESLVVYSLVKLDASNGLAMDGSDERNVATRRRGYPGGSKRELGKASPDGFSVSGVPVSGFGVGADPVQSAPNHPKAGYPGRPFSSKTSSAVPNASAHRQRGDCSLV